LVLFETIQTANPFSISLYTNTREQQLPAGYSLIIIFILPGHTHTESVGHTKVERNVNIFHFFFSSSAGRTTRKRREKVV
jgi:hypothetical protein